MVMHQCPKCELRFERKTELDDHCWHDHPEFRHEYPAQPPPPQPQPEEAAPGGRRRLAPKSPIGFVNALTGWLVPGRSTDRTTE